MRFGGVWAGLAFAGLMAVCVLTGAQASTSAPSVSEVAPGVYSVKNLPISEDESESSVAADKVAEFKASRSAGWSNQEVEASATDHADLGAAGAEDLFVDVFGSQVDSLLENPAAVLRSAEEVIGFRDDFTAVIDPAGPEDRALVVSTAPIRTDDGSLPNLGLESNGSSISVKEPTTEVEFAKDPREGIEIPQTDVGISVDEVRASAPDGSIVAVDGGGSGEAAFYPNALTDTDLIAAPLANGVETFAQLRSEDSPEEITMPVDTPDGGSVSASEDGGAVIMGADGDPVAQVYPPTAVDAKGEAVPMTMSVDGADLVLDVPHQGLGFAYPILVDPVVETWNWWTGTHTTYPGWQFLKIGDEDYQGSTYCFQVTIDSCGAPSSGGGLFAYAGPNKQYTQSSQARWMFVPPGSDSYISGATVTSWRYKKGGASNGNPFAYWGIASGFLWNDYQITDLDSGGNNRTIQGGTEAQQFAMGLTTNSTMTLPAGTANWRYNRIGAIQLSLGDKNPPNLNTISTTGLNIPASGWINQAQINSNRSIHASAWDSGLGVKKIVVLGAAAGGGWYSEAWDSGCTGGFQGICSGTTPSGGVDIPVRPSALNEGVQTLAALAIDAKDTNSTAQSFQVRIDKDGPTITKSGPLSTASESGDEITIRVDDNALSNPSFDSAGNLAPTPPTSENPNLRSGAKDFKLYVDGQQVDSRSRTCSATYGSCRLGPITFTPDFSTVSDGEHNLKIVAADQAGNSTQTTWQDTIDSTPPTIVSAEAESEWNSGAQVPVLVAGGDDLEGIGRVIVRRGATVVHSQALDCSSGCPNIFRDKVLVPVSGLVNGENTLSVSLEGPGGDEGNAVSFTTNVEKADPVISNIEYRSWHSDQSSIEVEASENLSGLAGVKVLDANDHVVGQTPFDCEEPCAGVEEIEVPLDLSGLDEGPQTLRVVVTSNAESESTQTVQVGVDRTPPNLNALGGSLAALADQYLDTNSSYTVTTGASDGSGPATSGLASITATWDGEENPLQEQRDCASANCESVSFNFDLSQVLDGYRTLTVEAADEAGNTTSEEIGFDLDRSGPAIEIRAENAASTTWGNGDDLEVAVDVTDGPVDEQRIGAIDVEIDGNHSQPLNEPSECEDLCTVLHFKVPNAAAGSHTVDVEATDTLGHTSQAQQVITLDRDAPTIEVDGDLEDGATVGGGEQGISVTAEESGVSPSGVAGIRLYVDGTMFEGGDETCDSGACAYEAELDENVLPVGQHRIEIKAPDWAGNIATESFLVERECSAGASTVTSVSNPVTAQDAVDVIESAHAGVVTPSQTEVIDGNELSPTLVERDSALDADSTAQPSQLAASDTPEMVVGVGDQSVCLRPSEIGDSTTEPTIVNEDTAVYANTSEATDTAVRPTVEGVESYSILRNEDAPESFSLEVGTPSDTELVENQDGTVSVTLDAAGLEVPERPDDIPPLDGQAAELVTDGDLPPGTVDAGLNVVEEAAADIAEHIGERPDQSQVELGIENVVPSETGSSVSDPALTAAETIGALEAMDEAAVDTGQDMIETESQAFEDAEQTAIDASNAAEAAAESDALDDIQAEDVEIAKISAPEAKDAVGNHVPVSLTADGSSIEVAVQHEGEGYEYPIAVDPVVETKKMVIEYEPYPVYRNERYISGYENVRKKIGMWDARSCKWTNCVWLKTSWYRISGKYLAWLPNGKNVAYKTPLYETYKKPIFAIRKVFDHWGQKPVLREQRTLDAQTSGGGSRKVGDMQTGMNLSGFQVDAYDHATDSGVKTVPSMKEQQGINTAVLNPHWYVNSLNGWRLKPWYGKDGKSPRKSGVASLLQASANQMSWVVMKPHLEVDGKSRTEFLPAKRNRSAFWKRYEKFIRFHATLMANNTNGNPNRAFVIGTELSQLQGEAYTGRWSRMVNVAKAILPHGTKIYYAANWDTIDNPPRWWSMLDGLGVDAYPGWYSTPWNANELTSKLSKLHDKVQVPVFFSETGAYTEERYKKRKQYDPILPERTPQQQANVYRDILNAVVGLKRRLDKEHKHWFLGVWWYDRYTRATPKTEGNTYDMWTPRPGAVKALCTYQTARPGKC